MTKIFVVAAVAGLALIAVPSAFAGQGGRGGETQNAAAGPGVAVNWNKTNVIWLAGQREVRPTVSAQALTGMASDPDDTLHIGRLTTRTDAATDRDDGGSSAAKAQS
jgi:hypothetical protein